MGTCSLGSFLLSFTLASNWEKLKKGYEDTGPNRMKRVLWLKSQKVH